MHSDDSEPPGVCTQNKTYYNYGNHTLTEPRSVTECRVVLTNLGDLQTRSLLSHPKFLIFYKVRSDQ